jgi:TPR repeat protein
MTSGGPGMTSGGMGTPDIIALRRWKDRRSRAAQEAAADAGPGTQSQPGPAQPGQRDSARRVAEAIAIGSAGRGSVEWLRAAAESGNTEAMVRLGGELVNVPGRFAEAEGWLRRAAETGDPQGKLHLGRLLLFDGRAGEAEPWLDAAMTVPGMARTLISDLRLRGATELAHRWLEKVAEAGDADAALDLAVEAIKSDDHATAERWAEWARKLGHAGAEMTLALAACERRDDNAMSFWLARAAAAGQPLAAAMHGLDLASQGRSQEARALLEQVAKADIEKAAGGDPELMYLMAWAIFRHGDRRAALGAFQLAARHGSAEAALMAGRLLLIDDRPADALSWLSRPDVKGLPDGGLLLGMAQDRVGQRDTARQTYAAAARAGDPRAAVELGYLYEHENDLERAIAWYERAADGGDAKAMNNLGMIFIDRDPVLAQRWLRKAADLGHGMAAHTMAVIAMREGRDADMRTWLRRAAALGNEYSVKALEELAKLDARREHRGSSRWRRR